MRTIGFGDSLVVSTGEGMPCFHDNMEYIKATGVTVFLGVPVEILVRRILAHAHEDLPLKNAKDPALASTLEK